jgi:hypothetical protein
MKRVCSLLLSTAARDPGWIAFFGDCAQITSRRRKISKEPRTMSVRRIDQ